MAEHEERMADLARQFPGPRGQTGKTGAAGPAGTVPRSLLKAFIFFTLLNLGLLAVVTAGLAHYVSENSKTRCGTISAVAAIPIPTQIAGHDARLWEARFEGIYRARARQLGCHYTPPKGK